MIKRFLIGTSLLLGSFMAPSSFAEESKDFYLSIGGGVASPSDTHTTYTLNGIDYKSILKLENSGFYSFGIGKHFKDFRVELNFSKVTVKNDEIISSADGQTELIVISPPLETEYSSYMVYGYKDFPNDSKFTPYAGIGLGNASMSLKNQTVAENGITTEIIAASTEQLFSYAIKGGGFYELSENTSLYSEINYQIFGSLVNYDQNGTKSTTHPYNHLKISTGIKFNF